MADRLLEVAWVSLVAGVGITAIFSLVIHWAARSTEERRAGRDGAATRYVALSLIALALFFAAVLLALQIMLSK
jgi:hypothetical protein